MAPRHLGGSRYGEVHHVFGTDEETNRFISEIEELRPAVWNPIEYINLPGLTDYLSPSV